MHLVCIDPDPECKATKALHEYLELLSKCKNCWTFTKRQREVKRQMGILANGARDNAIAAFRQEFPEFNHLEVKVNQERIVKGNNISYIRTYFEVKIPYVR